MALSAFFGGIAQIFHRLVNFFLNAHISSLIGLSLAPFGGLFYIELTFSFASFLSVLSLSKASNIFVKI